MKRNKKHINESSWYGLFYDLEIKPKTNIKNIDMIPTNTNQCNVLFDGQHVYSNAVFYPGDIVEICPTKQIDKQSLYSRDMRNIVFEVVPNEVYVIPFGYCQYYDIVSNNKNNIANCDYIWDSLTKCIIIKAIDKISANKRLILNI